jgi:hypothetical protein
MVKGLSLLIFAAAALVCLPAYAGDEDEAPKGFLSFSFDPGKFFQVGPTGEGEAERAVLGTEEIPKETREEKVRDARAFVSFSLYGLFNYIGNESDPSTFDMRGAYVKGEGEWKNYKLSIMTNAAVNDALTWAYIDMAPWVNHKEKVKLRLGIFAVPFGQQIQTFPFDLSSIDYSLIVQDVTDIVGIYDKGMMIHGNFKVRDGGLNYALAILNGESSRTTDTNESKTLAGRIGFEFTPFIEVGGSYYKGNTTDIIWAFDCDYERVGVDLKWKPGNFKIRGEFMSAIEDPESHYSGSPPVWDPGVSERTEGWWIDAGAFLWVNEKISDKYEKLGDRHELRGIEVYLHYQGFAPPPSEDMRWNTGHASRTQFVYGIGVNIDLSRNVRLQALWQHFDLGRYALGKYSGFDPAGYNDKVTVQFAIAVF